MLDENNRIIFTLKLVSKLRYRAHDPKMILLLHFTKSLMISSGTMFIHIVFMTPSRTKFA